MNFAPKSIAGLVVLGLFVVVLPSLVANARALFVVDSLSTQSQTLVSLGVEMMRDTETVKDDLVELERRARQYQITKDTEEDGLAGHFEEFRQISSDLTNRLELMATMTGDGKPAEGFTDLAIGINQLTDRYVEDMSDERIEANISELQTLRELAAEATSNGQQLVNRRMEDLRLAASGARSNVIWQALTVIPGTLVLMLLITYLVSRPVQRIIKAIRDLGHGVFDRRVRISGPAELASLGHELNWLGRRLSEADQEKHDFLKSMSHDLKTPIASIREGSELLHDQLIGDLNNEQSEVCGIIRDSSIMLQSQIENLLNFKLSDALDNTEPERFKLNELLRAVRAQQHLALTQKQINLMVDGGAVWITGYREKLRIALDNLISNAVKVAPDDSTIQILARKKSDRIQIDVIDQGPGVSDADRDLIFRPFFQGQTPQTGQIKGTGLGLSVASDSVKAHGGTLELMPSDSARNKGAHFRITLPNKTFASNATRERRRSLRGPAAAYETQEIDLPKSSASVSDSTPPEPSSPAGTQSNHDSSGSTALNNNTSNNHIPNHQDHSNNTFENNKNREHQPQDNRGHHAYNDSEQSSHRGSDTSDGSDRMRSDVKQVVNS